MMDEKVQQILARYGFDEMSSDEVAELSPVDFEKYLHRNDPLEDWSIRYYVIPDDTARHWRGYAEQVDEHRQWIYDMWESRW